MASPRLAGLLKAFLTYSAIILITALLVDLLLIATGLFPPPRNPGHAGLGWMPARPTGEMATGKCVDLATGEDVLYQRNEDGIRTSVSRKDTVSVDGEIRIAVTGDSHTDLCSTNEELHSGVLEAGLRKQGVDVRVLSFGVGRYSPLQDYLAFRDVLRKYHPRVLVLNLYMGNDFYDMLRIDDRPHFVKVDTGYRIAPPAWYAMDDPDKRRRSRVLAFIRAIGDKTGIRTAFQRLSYLRAIGGRDDQSLANDIAYMRNLLAARDKTLGYPDALTAQMLNQQLYFHHFPSAMDESVHRVRAVMAMARAENPDVLLLLSPIPSYQLVGESPVDAPLIRAYDRLPITLEHAIDVERALYDSTRAIASEEGWLFVDNLAALRAYTGSERLYNGFDYHLERVASTVIGVAQRDVLLPALRVVDGGSHD